MKNKILLPTEHLSCKLPLRNCKHNPWKETHPSIKQLLKENNER